MTLPEKGRGTLWRPSSKAHTSTLKEPLAPDRGEVRPRTGGGWGGGPRRVIRVGGVAPPGTGGGGRGARRATRGGAVAPPGAGGEGRGGRPRTEGGGLARASRAGGDGVSHRGRGGDATWHQKRRVGGESDPRAAPACTEPLPHSFNGRTFSYGSPPAPHKWATPAAHSHVGGAQPMTGRASRHLPTACHRGRHGCTRVLPPTRMGPMPRPDRSCLRLPRTGRLARLKPLPRIAVSRATSWRRPLARPPKCHSASEGAPAHLCVAPFPDEAFPGRGSSWARPLPRSD